MNFLLFHYKTILVISSLFVGNIPPYLMSNTLISLIFLLRCSQLLLIVVSASNTTITVERSVIMATLLDLHFQKPSRTLSAGNLTSYGSTTPTNTNNLSSSTTTNYSPSSVSYIIPNPPPMPQNLNLNLPRADNNLNNTTQQQQQQPPSVNNIMANQMGGVGQTPFRGGLNQQNQQVGFHLTELSGV